MQACTVCGRNGFKTWGQYNTHYNRQHGLTMEMGLPRLNLEMQDAPKPYIPMDATAKRAIIDKIESDLRVIAWTQNKLNCLIGEDKISVEPVWDTERNVL